MINVLVVEDSAIVRRGIVSVLQKQPDLEVTDEAENGVVALALLRNGLRPDILLTDLNMPEMNGLELINNIRDMNLPLPAIILTMHSDTTFMENAMAAGARGYLLKNGDMDELVACIKSVNNGQFIIGEGLK